MKPFLTFLFLFILTFREASSQSLALGKWQTHFSPLSGKNILETNGRIYYTTHNGLFSIDPPSGEVNSWSKSDGFNDIGVSALAFDKEENLLLVAYRSGLIDFVILNNESFPAQIEPWTVLSQTPGITTSRAVHKMVLRDDVAYLCTDFGIVKLNTKLRQVEESYRYIGPAGAQVSVKDVAFTSDSVFAVTSAGLLAASLKAEVNRQYYANWHLTKTPASAVSIAYFENRLYAGFDKTGFFERNGNSWNAIFNSQSESFQTDISDHGLLISEDTQLRLIEPDRDVRVISDPLFEKLSSAIQTAADVFWVADKKQGAITNQAAAFQPVAFQQSDTTIFPKPDSIVTDLAGLTWARIPDHLGGGIAVKDQNGKQRILTSIVGGGSLPSNTINSLAIDTDGYIWFASDRGAGYFSPEGILDGTRADAILPVYGQRRLFSNEKCTAIAVEPGNRKWLATGTGLYLFNPDGTEMLAKFDTKNSPLPSNNVTALKMEAETGLLFVDTPNGMVSYQTTASAAAEDLSNVSIFPNPVRPNYGGLVGFKGLKEQSTVKITSLSGRLVYETKSEGGTASWNLQDYTGRRVTGGIYMVFIVAGDRTEKLAGKLAVIN